MLPGTLPFILASVPRSDVQQYLWIYQLAIAVSTIGLSVLAFWAYSVIEREGEQHSAINALTYGVIPLCMLLAFPRQPEFAAVSLVILAFGDGSASLFGQLWGARKLPWNPRKSWVGFAAFILCAGPAAAVACWLHAIPVVTVTTATVCGIVPTIICAGIESLSSDCCENLRISGTAAIMVVICSSFFVAS
ncbi:hypothetical protein [Schlesneria paludicola]|uniref:hypothetical protein n=1 Tax=Schlesneria paludicola TaxID=360056 RepID=UPI0012F73AE8|nr:hypothetical protein [Schlesneria paludicola]